MQLPHLKNHKILQTLSFFSLTQKGHRQTWFCWNGTPGSQLVSDHNRLFQALEANSRLTCLDTTARLKVNHGHTIMLYDVAHLHPLTNVPTKYQLHTPAGFRDIARTRFYRSRSLRQGQRSNQGHTMTLHTYTPPTMYLQSTNFLNLTVSEI